MLSLFQMETPGCRGLRALGWSHVAGKLQGWDLNPLSALIRLRSSMERGRCRKRGGWSCAHREPKETLLIHSGFHGVVSAQEEGRGRAGAPWVQGTRVKGSLEAL